MLVSGVEFEPVEILLDFGFVKSVQGYMGVKPAIGLF